MFKRIVKVVGFVLLGFVLLIGGVVGFMAIRGDFKKQVIKPTAINFSINKTDLIFDAQLKGEPTLANEQIFSFTISAEPLNVTETECTIKISNSNLVTFVEWKDGRWVEYNSNKFILNKPIYFKLNDITVDNVEDYYDGVLTITVKDKTGLLQDSIDLKIDRAITSISFVDQGNINNNVISNGLFGYEEGKYNGVTTQNLEAIEGEDYPLEVVTAPLKASKPFSDKNAKIYEVYYVEDEQPKLLTHYGEVVKMQRYNDQGVIVEDACDFLRYDTTNNHYVFNSQTSGAYEFKLVTYPTYKIQEEILSQQDVSFIERLQNENILTKSVVITVNGTEAEEIAFEGDNSSIRMELLQDNKWIANNNTKLDMYDLGLTLSKSNSGTEISGRYNELKFLEGTDFTSNVNWTFKQAIVDGSNVTYREDKAVVNFSTDGFGNTKAIISGLDAQNIDNSVQYDVNLTYTRDGKYYTLVLSNVTYESDGETIKSNTTITFHLVADDITGRVLSMQEDALGLTNVEVYMTDEKHPDPYTPIFYLDLEVGNCFVLDKYNETNQNYGFKTIKSGLYFTLLGQKGDSTPTLINDKFITSVEHLGADSIITVKPVDGDLSTTQIELYALVVNSNGSWTYTKTSKIVVVDEITSSIVLSNNGDLSLPVVVGSALNFGNGFDVEDLVGVEEGGSYSEILMFAPRYSLLTSKPIEWETGLVVYSYNADTGIYTPMSSQGVAWNKDVKYYTKNNFKTIDYVNIQAEDGTIYYLLGYVENDSFVNKVVATDVNHYAKLYPVLVKSRYLPNENRLQTAVEFVNDILTGETAVADLKNGGGQITYDLTLLPNRQITKNASVYVLTADSAYNANKTYYLYNALTTQYEEVEEMPKVVINNWATEKNAYFEKVDFLRAEDALGEVSVDDTSNINASLTYYTLTDETLTKTSYAIGSSEFIASWGDYYIIVSHYVIGDDIADVANDSTTITIKAYPYSKGIKLPKAQTFEISTSNYYASVNGAFEVNYAELYLETMIATSYYDFANSSVKPVSVFGGTYFNYGGTKVEESYQIIAGHKDVNVGWDGVNSDTDAISSKDAKTYLYISNIYNEQILQDIISKLTLSANKYNSTNNMVGPVGDNISISDKYIDYVMASATYCNMPYYTFSGGAYTRATIDETIVADWSNVYTQYYVKAICATFTVSEPIETGNYVKFEWIYASDNGAYKSYGDKLVINSRSINGYKISANKVLYQATLITQENKPTGDYYSYNKDTNRFTKVTDGAYTSNTYYSLSNNAYMGDIYYLLEIGYTTDYTYEVCFVDNNGNYLYYKDAEDNLAVSKQSLATALTLKADGGNIEPTPFYALNPEFKVQGNSYLTFKYDEFSKSNYVTFAQITTGFNKIYLQPIADASINYPINIKVVANSAFAHNPVSVEDVGIKNQLSTKEVVIPSKIYTYNSYSIDKILEVAIDDFSIIKVGQNVSDLYTIISNPNFDVEDENNSWISRIVDKENGNTFVDVKFKASQEGGNWVVSRATYDTVSVTIKFTSVLGTKPTTFNFESPYDIDKSTTNPTTVIYSGTSFVLAKSATKEELKDVDALYTFTGDITIKHAYSATNIQPVEGKWIYSDIQPVNEPTNCEFEIYYDGEKIGTFMLTIMPNVLITADIGSNIKLDDLNNSEYDFTKLGLSKFDTTKEYITYNVDADSNGWLDDLQLVSDLSTLNLDHIYHTYTNDEFTTQYTTNVVVVSNNKLQVISPISKAGTYYVNVSVNSGDIVVGNVKFEITTKSEIVNGNNQEVEPITITAKTSKEYLTSELNQMFSLARGSELLYKVNAFVAGKTYDKDGKLMANDDGSGEYYQKYELSDILWLSTTNTNLQVDYIYENHTFTQINNAITYNNDTYNFVGTSYNMDNYTFDIFNNKFVNNLGQTISPENIGKNIAYTVVAGQSVIYLKQNAYLFVNKSNDNDIMVLSIEDGGKTIYKFNANVSLSNFTLIAETNYKGVYYKLENDKFTQTVDTYVANQFYKFNVVSSCVGELDKLTLTYVGVGEDLTTDAKWVDTLDYSVELVYNSNINIKTNDIYSIYVQPYKIACSKNIVLNNQTYLLYDSTNNNGMFGIDGNSVVESISFGTSTDYDMFTQGTATTIIFHTKGNGYTTSIPVTLTYKDGKTYTYNVTIDVMNNTVVNIKYPYNVDNSNLASYNVFNASLSELSKSVDNRYEASDFAKWLGVDINNSTWNANTQIKYDLALKGDTINLANDELLNINRFNAYTFEHIGANEVYSANSYYKYNMLIKNFELVTSDTQPNDWGVDNYFKRTNSSSAISNIELVAVSTTYVNNLDNVVDSLALNGNTIAISTSLNDATGAYTGKVGYMAFKVYAGDTGAYGYYVVKVVDDANFRNTIAFGKARNSKTISTKLTADRDIIEVIRTSGYDIYSTSTGNFGYDLIESDNSNVYLFKVNASENIQDSIKNIDNGGYIANNTKLSPTDNIQTITVAVVIKSENSLVYVCNYEIVLQPNIVVTINKDADNENKPYATIDDENYFKYEVAKALDYNYTDKDENEIDVAGWFEVTKDVTTLTSPTLTFARELGYSDGLTVDTSNIVVGEAEIAKIESESESDKLQLKMQPSYDVSFWVQLSYGEFVMYVHIYINGFEWKPDTQFEVGGIGDDGTFNNDLDLSKVFGDYTGAFTIETTSSDKISNYASVTTDRKLTLKPASEAYTINVTVKLTGVAPNIEKTIIIKVNPNISATFSGAGANQGSRANATPVIFKEGDTLTADGSGLYVEIDKTNAVKKINIKSAEDGDTYLTIKAGEFSSVGFTLTDDAGEVLKPNTQNADPYNYFVGYNNPLTESGALNFVHSASDIKLRLNITINMSGTISYATTYQLYITLPKTYELNSIYRVEGAKYETVIDGKDLTLKQINESGLTKEQVAEMTSIDNHFFGTEDASKTYTLINTREELATVTNVYTKDNSGKYNKVTKPSSDKFVVNRYYCKISNTSRISIKVGDNYYYGYNNVVGLGLFETNNPNKLAFNLTSTSATNTSSIDNGEITFRSTDNVGDSTLTLSNTTTSISYNFKIFSVEDDYNTIEYNNELLQIAKEGSNELDYVSLSYSQFFNANNEPTAIDLAYLNYLPDNSTETKGWTIYDTTKNVNFTITQGDASSNYVSAVKISLNNDFDETALCDITVTIVTMNGVAKQIRVIISDFDIEYGYLPDTNYETAYAGTQIGKLSDKLANDKPRVAINGSTTFTAEYIGAVNGSVSHWYLGVAPDYPRSDTSLVSYDEINKIIASMSVAKSTPVTMMFDVTQTVGSGDSAKTYVIGRIYYNLMLENNIKIGLNKALDNQNAVDLYLGSQIYDINYKLITTTSEFASVDKVFIYNADTEKYELSSKEDGFVPGRYYKQETVIELLQSQDYVQITKPEELEKTKAVYTKSATGAYTQLKTKPTDLSDGTYYMPNNYNNLFVTLEQYSSDNIITETTNNALYNGDYNTYRNTGSYLDKDVVSEHLRFSVSDAYSEAVNNVRVDANGKLYIAGNPSGSFTLNIFSANGTGYGESFAINLHKYDNTIAQFSEQVNKNKGSGFMSGESKNLFKDIASQEKLEDMEQGDYAFATYREGYDIKDINKLPIGDDITIKYQILTFDYETTVAEIKQPSNWTGVSEVEVDEANESFILPSVKYSTSGREYQIVSVRLSIEYNGQTDYYFAHYQVYNPESLNVNAFYTASRGQVITYNEEGGAWTSADINKIVVMDINNSGMYSAVTLATGVTGADWENEDIKYYINNTTIGQEGTYITADGTTYDSNTTYYKLNKVASNINDYKVKLVFEDGTYEFDNLYRNGTQVYIDLTELELEDNEVLFSNQADFRFIIEAKNGGAALIEDDWTFKADTTIDAIASRPLKDFFLTSEIGNQDYYNINIIGIGTDYNSFVTGEDNSDGKTVAKDVADVELPNDYQLKMVTYQGTGSNDIFKVEATYYVLVGHSTAMSFDFNGGSDYYINLTIDNDEIVSGNATIDISQFVKVWGYNTNAENGEIGFVNVDENNNFADKSISVVEVVEPEKTAVLTIADSSSVVKLSNINTILDNLFATVTITDASGISRTIQLYFNIIINAKQATGGIMPYSQTISNAIGTDGILTSDEVEDNIELKKELLSLITFDDRDVVVNNTVDSCTLSCYTISAVTNSDTNTYDITYIYTSGSASYTRTLKLSIAESSSTGGETPDDELTQEQKNFNELFNKIKVLEEISYEYNPTDYQKRAITYIRSVTYNGMAWNMLLGSVDAGFVTKVEEYDTANGTDIANFRNLSSLEFTIPSTNEKVDFFHLFAVMEGYMTNNTAYADFTGWGGDLLQLAGEVYKGNITQDQVSTKFNASTGSVFGSADVCADFDGVNIIANLKADSSKSLYEHIVAYYTGLTVASRISQFKQNNFTETYSTQEELKNVIFARLQTASSTGYIAMGFSTVFGYKFNENVDNIKKCIEVFVDYIY